jgi:hypothetical protein
MLDLLLLAVMSDMPALLLWRREMRQVLALEFSRLKSHETTHAKDGEMQPSLEDSI